MKHEQLAAPDLIGALELTAPATPKPKRTTPTNDQRNSLYVAAYPALRELCYETYSQLIFSDCENILLQLAQKLPKYRGKNDPDVFMKWAGKFVTSEAKRYELLHRCLGAYRGAIVGVIRQQMYQSASAMDLSIEADDLFIDIVDYLFKHAHNYNKPGYLKEDKRGRVKQLTRVCALAKKHVWFYFNSPLTKHMKRIEKNFAAGMSIDDAEQLSELEIEA